MKTVCRICGFDLEYPIWGEKGDCPTHDICPCCGVEFGYEDSQYNAILKFRKEWMDKGAQWFRTKMKPKDWDIQKQFRNIPNEYL